LSEKKVLQNRHPSLPYASICPEYIALSLEH